MFARFTCLYVVAVMTILAAAIPNNTTPTKTATTVTSTKTESTTVTASTTQTTTVTVTVPTTTPVTTTIVVTPPPATTTVASGPSNQCNIGSLQCCQSVQPASSDPASLLLGLLNIVVPDVTVLIGITCSPIPLIGVGATSCNAQPVCCEDASFHGVVAVGCTPININA